MNKFMCTLLGVSCGIIVTLGVVTDERTQSIWKDMEYHKSQQKIKDELIEIVENTKSNPYEYTVNQKVYWSDTIKSLSLHKHKGEDKIYTGAAHTYSEIAVEDNKEIEDSCSWQVAEVHLHPDDNNGFLYSGVTHVDGECKVLHTHSDNSLCAEEHSDPVEAGVIELKTHSHDNGEIHTGPSHTENNLLEAELISETTYDGRIDSANKIMYEIVGNNTDIIHAINIEGVSYVNDGIFIEDGRYVQTDIGFNRVEYIKTAWFDYLPHVLENMLIDVYKEGNSYLIKFLSPMDVYSLTGFSQMANETERVLEIIINVDEDKLISSITQGLTILTEDGVSTMTVEIPQLYKSQSIAKLEWNGLEYTEDKELKLLEGIEIAKVPETIGGLPYGASPLILQLNQGVVVPYMKLEDEFYSELDKKTIELDDSDVYKVGNLSYDDGGELFYVLNTKEKYIESLVYKGPFMTEYMHYQLPSERLDRYRIAPNYVSDTNGKDGKRVYKGEVLGKEYTVELEGTSLGFTEIREYSQDTEYIIKDYDKYIAKLNGEPDTQESK